MTGGQLFYYGSQYVRAPWENDGKVKQFPEGHGFSFSYRAALGDEQHQVFRHHLRPCDVFESLVIVEKRHIETTRLYEFVKISRHCLDEIQGYVRQALGHHAKER